MPIVYSFGKANITGTAEGAGEAGENSRRSAANTEVLNLAGSSYYEFVTGVGVDCDELRTNVLPALLLSAWSQHNP